MAEFPTKARVVIIGGGVVGVSTLYHLAKRGWTDCVLLEKNELTAGSTWHAAGNVPTFSTSWAIMNMQRYSTELYARLGEEVDYPMNYHQTGSLRFAHTKERVTSNRTDPHMHCPVSRVLMRPLHPWISRRQKRPRGAARRLPAGSSRRPLPRRPL